MNWPFSRSAKLPAPDVAPTTPLNVDTPLPKLPGMDTNGGLYFARGRNSGPRFRCNTIQPSDPIWLKLAYLERLGPQSSTQVSSFLISLIPPAIYDQFEQSRAAREPVMLNPDFFSWKAELDAVLALRIPPSTAENSKAMTFRTMALEELLPGKTPWFHRGRSIEELFANLQHLAISALWAFGREQPDDVPWIFAAEVSIAVGHLLENVASIYSRISLAVPAKGASADFDIDYWRRMYFDQGEDAVWLTFYEPKSVGSLIEGLHRIIGSVGLTLGLCLHCGRIFERVRRSQKHCSDYCRKIDFQQKKKEKSRNKMQV